MDYRAGKTLWLYLILIVTSCTTNSQKNVVEQTQTESEIDLLKEKAKKKYFEDDFIEAINLYTKLIELDSVNGEYYYRRAYSLTRLDKDDASMKDYLKSASLNHRVDDCYFNIGVINSIAFLNDSLAIYYFKKALEANPDMQKAKSALEDLGVLNIGASS